jgi:hypothetical protein
MKPTTFLVVLAATAVSVVAAGYAVVSESRIQAPAAASGAPVFGDLLARANDVQSVTVASASGKFTIARKGDGWALAEKDGYPVAADKLRQLVAGLADLRLLEAKTDQPDRHARLEVEDIAAKDAKSKQVTLAGADGKRRDLIVARTTRPTSTACVASTCASPNAQWLGKAPVEVPRRRRLGRPHGGQCRRGQDPAPAVRADGRARADREQGR